ncbi:MAG: dTDP-glucose 4,6-dehydratase [Pelotomaculum sp. PtaU1.Bin035]|nr:MAG: dTDP-glucose 4,6-dehydratase [Pelotomaculum sp. PtaU1.Bin035]
MTGIQKKHHTIITGGAGFIGSHLVDRLLDMGWQVTIVDNFDRFYDPLIKEKNISKHIGNLNCRLIKADIRDLDNLRNVLADEYDVIVHLAAKAGVRPSILAPLEYQEVNIKGTQNLLEFAKEKEISQFVFASSSSVYGVNQNVPWTEEDHVLMPISPYAFTKVSGELLGHVYSHLYGIRFIALRFFTVYGPRQRPDLAIYKFVDNMLRGEPITVYGDGATKRDYTYIDDVIVSIIVSMRYNQTTYEVINIGGNHTVILTELISSLENILGVKAKIKRYPEQPGDVPQTYADIGKAKRLLRYMPSTSITAGLNKFVEWVKSNQRK